MKICPLCSAIDFNIIYQIDCIPVFQNKVYPTEKEAIEAVTGKVSLAQCDHCGFVFNRDFSKETMQYDPNYQNEQNHSKSFQSYIEGIIEIIKAKSRRSSKIVEIGCGKGYFIEQLLQNGMDAVGFDPAYEGDNPNIIKEYFNSMHQNVDADIIVLRHVLEHIENPFVFLKDVATANGYQGRIFIEVPCFEWITKKKAFWDIFHEHCNYFTAATLSSMFHNSEVFKVFGEQYLFLSADLKQLKPSFSDDLKAVKSPSLYSFSKELVRYRQFIKAKRKPLFIWGAGAKGAAFVNQLDSKKKYIDGIIDINPKKQNKYIARTAHKIYGIDAVDTMSIKTILIMNENYFDEIAQLLSGTTIKLNTLGEL